VQQYLGCTCPYSNYLRRVHFSTTSPLCALLDELAHMEARLTSALAGRCGEQSERTRFGPPVSPSTTSPLCALTWTWANLSGSAAARSHCRASSPHRSLACSSDQTSTLAASTATVSSTIELKDPQPQVEVVESTHPPLVVYDSYVEHDLYASIEPAS
jgi:hypothetical protein